MIVEVDDGNVEERTGRSWLQKYMDRMDFVFQENASPQNITLWEFVRHLDIKPAGNGQHEVYKRPKALPRILNVYPKYSHLITSEQYEDFCRVKMMLHHPFQTWEDVERMMRVDNSTDEDEPSYKNAFIDCLNRRRVHERDCLDPLDEEEDDKLSEYEDDDGEEDSERQPAWAGLAERHGGYDAATEDLRVTTVLGTRRIDLEYNWHSNDHHYDVYGDQLSFYTRAKTVPAPLARINNNPEPLQASQRLLYDLVLNQYHYQTRTARPLTKQLLLHIDGEAGTGKSYIIDILSQGLYDAARTYYKPDLVCRAAPTGVAAFNIHGKTLHSLLRLPVHGRISKLANTTLIKLQKDLQHCLFLIIDEKSMVSLRELHWIDLRLRDIYPERAEDSFGGLNVLLFGNFYQLPPVAAQPLYDVRPSSKDDEEITSAQNLCSAFDRTIVLDKIMRQRRQDKESSRFRETLRTLRTENIVVVV